MGIENPAAILYDADGHPLGSASYPLRTDPTGSTTQPISAASLPLPAGAATETGNLASILTKLADPATQTTLAAVLAKLSSDPATQTTLAAMLAKLDVALSTRASESGGNLATIAGKDFATQTTLASVLAKLDVALNTRAAESGGNLATLAGKDFATQTTLAAIKAKTDNLPTDPAREGGNLASAKTDLDNIYARQADGNQKTQVTTLPALPTGANTIGKVDQGAAGVAAWPVSGPLTDAELRASPVPVTGGGGGGSSQVEGRGAAGVAPVGNPVYVAGQDGSVLRALLTDTRGRLVTAPAGAVSSLAGFKVGYVALASITTAAVRATAYTEQTTNAQRSLASASESDTAAGTGSRTVRITYFDQTGAGPYTETVTLNGTSYVNTVSTTICFIENLEVMTVGSGGVNAGIITLKAATAGGGATIGTIALGDNRTFWAHHYVPTGKTTYITGMSVGHNGTTVGSGGLFMMKASAIGVSNQVALQISDFFRLYGQSSSVARLYGTAIPVIGPAKITMYVTSESSTSIVFRGSFDFYEQTT